MASATLSTAAHAALQRMAADLRRVFGNRLRALCAYGLASEEAETRTIVLVDRLAFEDFAACVPLARRWGYWRSRRSRAGSGAAGLRMGLPPLAVPSFLAATLPMVTMTGLPASLARTVSRQIASEAT